MEDQFPHHKVTRAYKRTGFMCDVNPELFEKT
jgi:hypothetical protein